MNHFWRLLTAVAAGLSQPTNQTESSVKRRDNADPATPHHLIAEVRLSPALEHELLARKQADDDFQKQTRATDQQRLTVEQRTFWMLLSSVALTIGTLGVLYRQTSILQTQVDAMRAEQRAWLGVSGITVTQDGPNAAGLVFLTNAGKTPARNLHFQLPPLAFGITSTTDLDPGRVPPQTPVQRLMDVAPNSNALVVIPPSPIPRDANASVFGTIRITYDDIAGCGHFIEVCRSGQLGSVLGPCQRNDEVEPGQDCRQTK